MIHSNDDFFLHPWNIHQNFLHSMKAPSQVLSWCHQGLGRGWKCCETWQHVDFTHQNEDFTQNWWFHVILGVQEREKIAAWLPTEGCLWMNMGISATNWRISFINRRFIDNFQSFHPRNWRSSVFSSIFFLDLWIQTQAVLRIASVLGDYQQLIGLYSSLVL